MLDVSNSIRHENPSRSKIPYPILKQSKVAPGRKASCPQIQKIKTNKSLASITNCLSHKRSVESIIVANLGPSMKNSCHLKQQFSALMSENSELINQLAEKENELSQVERKLGEIERRYVRLLEVTQEKSDEQIEILLQESEKRMNKSKVQSSRVSEKVMKLKSKLENLSISEINHRDNSIRLSEVAIL